MYQNNLLGIRRWKYGLYMVHVLVTMIPVAKLWSFSITIMWILSRATRWMTFWPHTSAWCWPVWTNRRVSKSEADGEKKKTKFLCIPKTDICNKDGRHFVPMEPVINFVLFIKDSPFPFIHDNPVQNPFLLYP